MNTFQLLCFVTLSNTATFSEAAEKLFISQSSFSNNIQSIEREMGVTLIVRDRRTLTLTDAGKTFLSYARSIVNEFDNVKQLLKDYGSSADNRVLIYADSLSSYAYNDILSDFKQKFPQIQAEIIELGEENLFSKMMINSDIIGIEFSSNKKTHPNTYCHTIISDRLAALVLRSHRLAERRRVHVSELGSEEIQIISSRQSRFLNEFTLGQFRKAEFLPNIASLDLWYNTAKEAVRELMIPAIFPERAAKLFLRPDLSVVGLNVDKFYVNMAISEQCSNAAAKSFYKYASEYLQKR